jgi:uncharacterized protein YkwD
MIQMGVMHTISSLLITFVLLLVLYALLRGILLQSPANYSTQSTIGNNYSSTHQASTQQSTLPPSTTQKATTTIARVTTQQYSGGNATVEYALGLINRDRNNYALHNVTLSSEPSAQQHANSMLANSYFSHWDTHGMKPYMRYTLLGGRGSVTENIAFVYNSSGINITSTLKEMEYNFMYNDYKCCQNGHRDNILNPWHNQVSIGIAYNETAIYFVEDFIDSYIAWLGGTPSVSDNLNVTLLGSLPNGYSLSSIQINYDVPVSNLTQADFNMSPYNGPYSYGTTVAGIGYTSGNEYFYFGNITTINATAYDINGTTFNVAFGLKKLEAQDGPGEYTIMMLLDNGTAQACAAGACSPFVGATYTIFVDPAGMPYIPSQV